MRLLACATVLLALAVLSVAAPTGTPKPGFCNPAVKTDCASDEFCELADGVCGGHGASLVA